MKPLDPLSDSELESLVRRAAELPDAPAHWVRRAIECGPAGAPALADAGRAAVRLLVAVLRFDSWAAGAPVAMGMRSMPVDTRHLLFSAMGRDVDVRITPSEDRFAVAGQILGPDESGRVELAGAVRPPRVAPIDDLGEFRLDGVDRGTYVLTLCMGSEQITLPPIEVGAAVR